MSKQSLIGGDCHSGPFDLVAGGRSTELPDRFAELGNGLSRDGLAEAGEAT